MFSLYYLHGRRFFLLLLLISVSVLMTASKGRKKYIEVKKNFVNYYFLKEKAADGLGIIIYQHGVPHTHFYRVYFDSNNVINEIVWEKDESEVYIAVTDTANGLQFFGNKINSELNGELHRFKTFSFNHAISEAFIRSPVFQIDTSIYNQRQAIFWYEVAKPSIHFHQLTFRDYLRNL